MLQGLEPMIQWRAANSTLFLRSLQTERQLPLCTARAPARDTRLDDAQDEYESPRTMHAAAVALRHAVGRPLTAPRHSSVGFHVFTCRILGERFATLQANKEGTKGPDLLAWIPRTPNYAQISHQ